MTVQSIFRTVDLSTYLSPDCTPEDAQRTCDEVVDAYRTIGFAYLKGYESIVPAKLIAKVFDYHVKFFDLPEDVKQELRYTSPFANRGFISANRSLKNEESFSGQKETFEVGNDSTPEYPEHWPNEARLTELAGFRETIKDFHARCHELQLKVLALIARSIGLPDTHFEPFVSDKAHNLRLLHYPARSRKTASGDVRFQEHTDVGLLTLLWALDVDGLEVLGPNGWTPCPPQSGTLTINFADALARCTNDVVKSTTHRTNLPQLREGEDLEGMTRARRSLAFFCNPNPDAQLKPFEVLGEPKYEPVLYKQYYADRLGPAVEVA